MYEKENRYYSAPFGLPLPLSRHLVIQATPTNEN